MDQPSVQAPAPLTQPVLPDATAAATVIPKRLMDQACEGLSPSTRATCPLLVPLRGIVEIPSGVRVDLETEANAQSVLAHLRCRIALARSSEAVGVTSCPLAGEDVSVRRANRPETIEIVGAGPESVAAIRAAAIAGFVYTRKSDE